MGTGCVSLFFNTSERNADNAHSHTLPNLFLLNRTNTLHTSCLCSLKSLGGAENPKSECVRACLCVHVCMCARLPSGRNRQRSPRPGKTLQPTLKRLRKHMRKEGGGCNGLVDDVKMLDRLQCSDDEAGFPLRARVRVGVNGAGCQRDNLTLT